MTMIRDLAWWYWSATVICLGAGLFGWPWGIALAVALTGLQIGHALWLTGNPAAFGVQVRAVYVVMLVAGLWGPMRWLHWMQLIGTTARVLIGYCLLARALALAPWNRWQPLSLALVRRTFLSLQSPLPPCGELFRRMSLERVQG